MTFVRRFSFITLLALSALGLGAHLTQAACSIETEGGYPAQIVNMSNSLSADQNTLTVNYTVNAGGGCDGVANQIEYQLTVSGSVPGAGSDFDTFSGTGRGLGITGSLSIGVGALSNGSYTVTLTASGDTPPPATQSQTFTINRTAPLSVGSCSGSPNPATTGSSMTWSVPTPTGGTGSYTYAWSGTDSLSGSTRTVSKTYSTTGTKNATIIVTSGAESATKNCSITANAPVSTPSVNLTGPLSVSSGSTATLTWTSQNTTSCTATAGPGFSTGGATSGSDVSSPLTAQTTFSIQCTGPGGSATDSHTVAVSDEETCNNVSVTSNIGTNWLIGGDGLSQALYSPNYPTYVTSGSYTEDPGDGGPLSPGSYTITADTPAGYNPPTITPSTTQTCSFGGSITFNLNYGDVPPTGGGSCSGPSSLALNQNGTFSGTDGASHAWSASGANPSSGSGASFTTKWATGGSKVVYMDGASGDYCTVCVGSFGSCTGGFDVTQQLDCQPSSQSVTTGQSANFAAYVNGNAMAVNWSATGGTPSSATRATTFSTVYGSTGSKTVNISKTATSFGQITTTYLPDSCAVTVTTPPPTTGTVVVTSNLATSWSITHPSGSPLEPSPTPSTGQTYTNQTAETYTIAIANVPDIAGYTKSINATSQTLAAGGTITFTITYTVSGGAASVDLEANGSDTPPAVAAGSPIDLSWTSNSVVANSCDASVDWTGTNLPAFDPSHAVTAAVTSNKPNMVFTITCDATTGGTVTDTVTVRLTQCSDGLDNDGQNGIDYPTDAQGCDNLTDDLEASQNVEPPPVVITECSDTLDNDGDGSIDFPNDDGCTSLEDNSEKYDPDIREI